MNIDATPGMIHLISKQIQREDEAKRKLFPETTNNKITSKFVGAVCIIIDDEEKTFEIRLADEDYFNDIDNSGSLIVGSLVICDDSDTFIAINNKAYLSYFSGESLDLSMLRGLLAHELGHYLSKHTEGDYLLSLDNYDQFNDDDKPLFDVIALSLLNGGISLTEYEADIQALRICHWNDILALYSSIANFSDTLGIRMEVMNRIKRHFECSNFLKNNNPIIFDFFLFSKEELENIEKNQIHQSDTI